MNPTERKQLVGQRIRYVRTILKMTQHELGQLYGVQHNTVSQWESGQNRPNDDVLLDLAKRGRVPLEWLLGGTDDASPPGQPQEPEELEALLRGRGFTKEDIEWIRMIEEKRARERKERGPKPKPDHPF